MRPTPQTLPNATPISLHHRPPSLPPLCFPHAQAHRLLHTHYVPGGPEKFDWAKAPSEAREGVSCRVEGMVRVCVWWRSCMLGLLWYYCLCGVMTPAWDAARGVPAAPRLLVSCLEKHTNQMRAHPSSTTGPAPPCPAPTATHPPTPHPESARRCARASRLRRCVSSAGGMWRGLRWPPSEGPQVAAK